MSGPAFATLGRRASRESYAELVTEFGGDALPAFSATPVDGLAVPFSCDGGPVQVEAVVLFRKTANAGSGIGILMEGANVLQLVPWPVLAPAETWSLKFDVRLLPTAGVHTYSVALVPFTAGGVVQASAAGALFAASGVSWIGALAR